MIAWLPRLWAVWVGCAQPGPMAPPPEPVVWLDSEGLAREIAADRACARGDAEACWWVGLQRRWEHDDPDGAWAAWSRGCDLGDGRACEAVAMLHRRGQVGAVDLAAARARYRQGCDGGWDGACAGLATVDRLIADRDSCWGQGEPDAMTCGRACVESGGKEICARAAELLTETCDRRDAVSCTLLGLMAGEGEEGNRWLWKACDLDDPWACLALADRVARGGENPSPKSLEWLFNQVCDIQLDYGCAVHQVPWME